MSTAAQSGVQGGGRVPAVICRLCKGFEVSCGSVAQGGVRGGGRVPAGRPAGGRGRARGAVSLRALRGRAAERRHAPPRHAQPTLRATSRSRRHRRTGA